jgi:hypothetical protein
MPKYTKRPWKIVKVSDLEYCISETVNKNRHPFFARVEVGNAWKREGKANAKLISAAPDLLEACKRAFSFFMDMSGCKEGQPVVEALYDSISKALGSEGDQWLELEFQRHLRGASYENTQSE